MFYRLKEKALSKDIHVSKRLPVYRELGRIRTCLVVWQANAEVADWLEMVGRKLPGVKTDKLCFVTGKVPFQRTDDVVILRKEELGFGGKIRNGHLPVLMARPYDLLLDLTDGFEVMIQYVLANSQARCIAGRSKGGGIADIRVERVEGQMEFIEKLTEILAEIKGF